MVGNSTTPASVISIDYGLKRIGIALASYEANIASPLITLDNDDKFTESLSKLIEDNNVNQLVVGLPRGLDGQDTSQTKAAEDFAAALVSRLNLPTDMQDESLTSVKAKEELEARGSNYDRREIDSLAASYILSDWLLGHGKMS
jgi:putative Holliday junction resolvase